MPPKELTIWQSALQRLRISRNGLVSQLVMDGQGAAVCLTADLQPAQKWAMSKTTMLSGNAAALKVLEKIEVLCARPGTAFATTRGSAKPLSSLMKAMQATGFDVNEWGFPKEVLDPEPEIGTQEWKDWQAEKKAKKEAQEAKNKATLDRIALAKQIGEQENKP